MNINIILLIRALFTNFLFIGLCDLSRALFDWSSADLSKRSGIGQSALMRFESSHSIPSGNIKTFDAIQKTFEEAGIEFIGSPEDAPGVRLRKK